MSEMEAIEIVSCSIGGIEIPKTVPSAHSKNGGKCITFIEACPSARAAVSCQRLFMSLSVSRVKAHVRQF